MLHFSYGTDDIPYTARLPGENCEGTEGILHDDFRRSTALFRLLEESRKDSPILLIQSHFDFGGTNAVVTRFERNQEGLRITIKQEIVKSTSSIDELVRTVLPFEHALRSNDARQEITPVGHGLACADQNRSSSASGASSWK